MKFFFDKMSSFYKECICTGHCPFECIICGDVEIDGRGDGWGEGRENVCDECLVIAKNEHDKKIQFYRKIQYYRKIHIEKYGGIVPDKNDDDKNICVSCNENIATVKKDMIFCSDCESS